jgi:flagellar protein FlaF
MSQKPNQPPSNPYASAAGAYGTNAQKHSEDPREVEARVLLKSANFLQDLQANWDNMDTEVLHETLKYNRNIWMMFHDTAMQNPDDARPQDLRNNIFNLANFIFKRELDIIAKPEKRKLDILISINRDIAAGLLTGVQNDAKNNPAQSGGTPQESSPSSSGGGWDTSA